MSGLFSSGKAPANYVGAATPPSMTDPSVQMAGSLAQFAAASAKGRQSTIATSGTGVPAPAAVTKKTILGG